MEGKVYKLLFQEDRRVVEATSSFQLDQLDNFPRVAWWVMMKPFSYVLSGHQLVYWVFVDIPFNWLLSCRYLASLRAVPGRDRRVWPEAKEAEGHDEWRPRRLDMDTSFG